MSDDQYSEQAAFYAKFVFTGYHVILDLAKDISRCYMVIFVFQGEVLWNMIKSILLFLIVYQFFVLVVVWPVQQTWRIFRKLHTINFLYLIRTTPQESLWYQLLRKSESMLLNLAGYLHTKIESKTSTGTKLTREYQLECLKKTTSPDKHSR